MSDRLIGQKLGDYVIQELLGRGGMARVYKGYDASLQRYAAVKIINSELAMVDQMEYAERFRREARAIARLNHPNIVGVYQFGDFENTYYMAMVFVEGRDLRQILREYSDRGERMPLAEVLNIVRGIGSALDYAHSRGVIHRDVKPSNIMLDTENNPVLTDFGLALSAWEGTLGDTFGSAHYIAPEQAVSSAKAVPQSDLYSLGICTYEMLVGKVPFDDPSAMSVALKHLNDIPPSVRNYVPELSPAVEQVISKVLDKDPERRYPTGVAFGEALSVAFGGSGISVLEVPVVRANSTAVWPVEPIRVETPPSREWVAMDSDEDTLEAGTPEFKEAVSSSKPTRERPTGRPVFGIVGILAVLLIIGAVVLIATRGGGDNGSGMAGATGTQGTETALAVGLVPSLTETSTLVVPASSTPARSPATATRIVIPPTITPAADDLQPTVTRPDATVRASNTPVRPTARPTTAVPRPSDTPRPTNTSRPSITPTVPTATRVPPSATPVPPTVTPTLPPPTAGAAVASSTPTGALPVTNTPAAMPTTAQNDVLLVYDRDQLNLINISERTLNLSALRFEQRSFPPRQFAAEVWFANGNAVYSPDRLPAGWCFQIARIQLETPPTLLPECSMRSSFILGNSNRWFWIATDNSISSFDVLVNDQKVASCPTAGNRCEFKMP